MGDRECGTRRAAQQSCTVDRNRLRLSVGRAGSLRGLGRAPGPSLAPTPLRSAGFKSCGRYAEHGFTLIEMLVALAVFSLAALALLRLQGVTLRTAADLDRRALAGIVARNLAVETLTDPAPPTLGQASGVETNGGRAVAWTRTVARDDDPRFVLVTVSAGAAPGASPAVLTLLRRAR